MARSTQLVAKRVRQTVGGFSNGVAVLGAIARHAVTGNCANGHAGRHDQISGHQHAARTLLRPGEARQQDPASGGCDPRDGGQQTDLQVDVIGQ